MARQTINIPITGDARSLRGALNDADGHLDRFESGIGGKLTRIATMVAGAFAVREIVNFGQQILTLGAQIETANVKIDTVFGDQADTIRQWADRVNESFGLTDTQVAGLAANMGDLLKPMGFTADQAATMSRESLELAGALSAWSGGTRSVAEVSEILTSAMLGEFETLKGLGISIDAAEVQTRALAIAQAEGRDEVTAMDEALATQTLILEKSTDAQAAWNDGSMDAIKTQNQLRAEFEKVRQSIAEALYPWLVRAGRWIVENLVPWIKTELVPALREWWSWIDKNVLPVIRDVATFIIEDVIPAVELFAEAAGETLVAAFNDVWSSVRDTFAPAMERVRQELDRTGLDIPPLLGNLEFWAYGAAYVFNVQMRAIGAAVHGAVVGISLGVSVISHLFGMVAAAAVTIAGAIRSVFTALVSGVRSAMSTLIDLWNRIDLSVPAFGISIPGVGSVKYGGSGDLVPDVPNPFHPMATGGIVTAPTLALIGEAGPEAVIPLNRAGAMGATYQITVNALDPQAAGRAVVDAIRSYERSNGKSWRSAA